MRTPRVAAGILMLALVGALSACVGAPPPDDVATYAYDGAGSDALLTGTLVREDGCTYLDDEFGERWLPIFPRDGLSWTDDALISGSQAYPLGGEARLGGGEGGRDVADVPEACAPSAGGWLVAP